MIQTHYLDWHRIWTEDGVKPIRTRNGFIFTGPVSWTPSDTGNDWAAQCADLWRRGYYQAGPVETAYRLPDDEHEALAVCDMLWHKYNDDDRPDGQQRRSMSAGDVIQLGEQLYLCRGGVGWSGVGWSAFNVQAVTP